MSRVIYGTDTGSIEDFGQCIVVDLPDDLDADETEEYIKTKPVTATAVVAWSDVVKAVHQLAGTRFAMDADAFIGMLIDELDMYALSDDGED